jgi:hypothetical protein
MLGRAQFALFAPVAAALAALIATDASAVAPVLRPMPPGKAPPPKAIVDAARTHPLPLLKSAASTAAVNRVATSVASRVPGANVKAIGAPMVRSAIALKRVAIPAGFKIPTAVSPSVLSLFATTSTGSGTGSSSSGSGSGSTSTSTTPVCGPTPSLNAITWEPVNSVSVASAQSDGSEADTCCGTGCASQSGCYQGNNNTVIVHTGDTLTISGSGFSQLAAQQVHLNFFLASTPTDVQANIISWNDTLITAQIPQSLHGMQNQMGILYLGPPNCTVQSTPWFFQYVQTITQQYVSFDASQYPLTVQANPGSLLSMCIEFDNTLWGSGPLSSNTSEYVIVAGGPTSYSCTGVLAPSATLVNGWTVAGAPVIMPDHSSLLRLA